MHLSHEAKTAQRNALGEIPPLGRQRVLCVYFHCEHPTVRIGNF